MKADERDYEGTMQFRRELEEQDDFDLNLKEVMSPEFRAEKERQWREEFQNVESATLHTEFTNALIAYIWNRAGEK